MGHVIFDVRFLGVGGVKTIGHRAGHSSRFQMFSPPTWKCRNDDVQIDRAGIRRAAAMLS